MSAAPTPVPSPLSAALAAFQAARDVLVARNLERVAVIDDLLACYVAGQHAVLLGPPGTGKSRLTRDLVSLSASSYFEYLLSQFTEPHELYGSVDVEGFRQGIYRRVTAGMLPEAEIVFLDEAFKANSAILNTLLAILNERLFHNGGSVVEVPLEMTVLASNELPQGANAALWDRCLVRHYVNDLQHEPSYLSLVQRKLPALPEQPLVSREAMLTLRARAYELAENMPESVAKALFKLRKDLGAASIRLSDRRSVQIVSYLGAVAALDGADSINEEHLGRLAAVLWERPDQIKAVDKALESVVAAWRVHLRQLMATFEAVKQEWARLLDDAEKTGRRDLQQASALQRDLKVLTSKAGMHLTGVKQPAVGAFLAELNAQLLIVRDTVSAWAR